MNRFKSIELFAGAGGLALGLERAGFDSLALIEYDKHAVATLRKNRPQWNVLHEDIENISGQDLEELFRLKSGELDLLSGGPPCQSFSYAGKRLGLEDARGTLFYHYALFLQKLQPKCFLFENVRGLLSHDKGKTYQVIHNVFEDSGYDVRLEVLNSWDYGVAQKRIRTIGIGIRCDLKDRLIIDFPKPQEHKPVLKEVLVDVPPSPGPKYSEKKIKLFNMIPQGGWWKDLPKDIADEYLMNSLVSSKGAGGTGILRRLDMEAPSVTIMTCPSQKITERCHPLETRPLTVRENARIQSFPDEWEFEGSMAQQYKQIGNAVPVNMAYYVAAEFYKGLSNLK